MLVITLEDVLVQALGRLISQPETAEITVDLITQSIRLAEGSVIEFKIDDLRKTALLKGLDAIGSTLQRSAQIREFEQQHLQANPWLR